MEQEGFSPVRLILVLAIASILLLLTAQGIYRFSKTGQETSHFISAPSAVEIT